MVRKSLVIVALISSLIGFVLRTHGQRSQSTSSSHNQWVAGVLKETNSIRVGMTRKDVLNVFTTEGGISTRLSRTYVYRGCPNIKVDIQFQAIQAPNDYRERLDDKIVSLSKPYLDYSISD
jgi:hypothetical protein